MFAWIKRLFGVKGRRDASRPYRYGLSLGINDYPGNNNDLQGCANDSFELSHRLRNVYYYDESGLIQDTRATVARFTQAILALAAKAVAGDWVTITFSGHGTSVVCTHGDEADGRDEAFCLYDGILLDNDMGRLMDAFKPGVMVTIFADCCHSGTITRGQIKDLYDKDQPLVRYRPPEDDNMAKKLRKFKIRSRVFKARGPGEGGATVILLSGCRDDQYSYDASFNGKNFGAFTFNVLKVIDANPDMTVQEFFTAIKAKLPSREYPQDPQLSCPDSALGTKLFGGVRT